TSMPFLSIVRSAALDTRSRIQRFSLSLQKRRFCRLGRKRRLVLLFAWETLFPTIGALPVTWQTRAIQCSREFGLRKTQEDNSICHRKASPACAAGGLQKAALGERNRCAVGGDDKMIKDPDVDEAEGVL